MAGINAADYREAALSHIQPAEMLYAGQRYVLVHYAAGLSVECIFRALRARKTTVFDERHDLLELAKSARFFDALVGQHAERASLALSEVVVRWRNEHRFRSEDALKRFLKERKLDRGVKGNFVKESSRRIVNSALELVTQGDQIWRSGQN